MPWRWVGTAFVVAVALVSIVLIVFGAGKVGTIAALQVTARFSFLLFWLAYAGGGLAVLLGSRLQPLRRHGRHFGVAFAAAQLVHVGVVAWLCWIGATPGIDVFVFFVPPFVVIYVLALFSLPSLQRALGRTLWALLRTVGMTYISYAFAVDFTGAPFSGNTTRIVMYAPFAFLSVAGPMLHLLSLLPSRRRTTPAR
jgi:hypothetical protein